MRRGKAMIMSVLDVVKDVVRRTEAEGGGKGSGSKGAYWCDDCGERIPDVEVDGDGPPACPSCGEEMRFERKAPSHCAC